MTNRRQFLAGLPVAAAAGMTAGFYTTPGNSKERADEARKAALAKLRDTKTNLHPNDMPVLCNPVNSGGRFVPQRDDGQSGRSRDVLL